MFDPAAFSERRKHTSLIHSHVWMTCVLLAKVHQSTWMYCYYLKKIKSMMKEKEKTALTSNFSPTLENVVGAQCIPCSLQEQMRFSLITVSLAATLWLCAVTFNVVTSRSLWTPHRGLIVQQRKSERRRRVSAFFSRALASRQTALSCDLSPLLSAN